MYRLRHYSKSGLAALSLCLFALLMAMGLLSGNSALAATPKGMVAGKYAAIVVDTTTGKVLYEASADERRYPASLTKMMTLYVLFEDLDRGRLQLDTPLKVSANAAAQPPSKLGLRAGDTILVKDAIRALVTKSANDAAATIGENLAGSVPAFATRMTKTARALGMSGTVFRNANGLPNPDQYTTARDMMRLGVALQVRFPQYYGYFKTASFKWHGKVMPNHNKLLGRIDGVDGIKTGYIAASGFNLVTSVNRDGHRLVAVVMGGKTGRLRDNHMAGLIATYLPKTVKGRAINADLVAKAAPVEAPAEAPLEVAAAAPAAAAGIGDHPLPEPRPVLLASAESAGPEVVPVAALPEPAPQPKLVFAGMAAPVPAKAPDGKSRRVKTMSLPVEPIDPMAPSNLPNSAAEAFADVAPLAPAENDALAAMIDSRIGPEPVEVAEAELPAIADARPPVLPRAEPVAAAPAPVKKAAKSSATGWIIQIGAVESEAAAAKLMNKAQAKVKVLAKADPVTESFTKGGQTYVRARFAGFASQDAAKKACAALKKNDFGCFPVKL